MSIVFQHANLCAPRFLAEIIVYFFITCDKTEEKIVFEYLSIGWVKMTRSKCQGQETSMEVEEQLSTKSLSLTQKPK